MEKNKNLIAGVALLVIGVIYFAMTFNVELSIIDPLVGSRLFPQICGGILIACSLFLIIDNVIKNNRGKQVKQIDEDGNLVDVKTAPKPNYKNTIVVLISLFIYVFLMELFGFIPSTFLYLTSQMYFLAEKKSIKKLIIYVVIAAITTATVYILFNNVFSLMLPQGNLF